MYIMAKSVVSSLILIRMRLFIMWRRAWEKEWELHEQQVREWELHREPEWKRLKLLVVHARVDMCGLENNVYYAYHTNHLRFEYVDRVGFRNTRPI